MRRRLEFKEGKCCDAVIRRLEARSGCSRSPVTSPEDDGHQWPVDFACSIDGQLFAIEHTGIEPFEGFLELILGQWPRGAQNLCCLLDFRSC